MISHFKPANIIATILITIMRMVIIIIVIIIIITIAILLIIIAIILIRMRMVIIAMMRMVIIAEGFGEVVKVHSTRPHPNTFPILIITIIFFAIINTIVFI